VPSSTQGGHSKKANHSVIDPADEEQVLHLVDFLKRSTDLAKAKSIILSPDCGLRESVAQEAVRRVDVESPRSAPALGPDECPWDDMLDSWSQADKR